jgi:hypothetical protein
LRKFRARVSPRNIAGANVLPPFISILSGFLLHD